MVSTTRGEKGSPVPIQILAATPVWTLKQAQEYKKILTRDSCEIREL